MTSIWMHQYYYLFGFLALMLMIVAVTCAEISIMLTYVQLTVGDYRWWWSSFFASGSSGLYVFFYSAVYYYTRLKIDAMVSTILYFGYMGILSCIFSLFTGACGFVSTFCFMRVIY